jgi:exodeoxyribonuclease VII large subunit
VVWVEGETAQVSQPVSGHVYFQLGPGRGDQAVIWRTGVARMKFRLDTGSDPRPSRLNIYERDGRFQLVDFAGQPGSAQALALQQLRARGRGLFAGRKRPLPHVPRKIGVVTSASSDGARRAPRSRRRFPRPSWCRCAVRGQTRRASSSLGCARCI